MQKPATHSVIVRAEYLHRKLVDDQQRLCEVTSVAEHSCPELFDGNVRFNKNVAGKFYVVAWGDKGKPEIAGTYNQHADMYIFGPYDTVWEARAEDPDALNLT